MCKPGKRTLTAEPGCRRTMASNVAWSATVTGFRERPRIACTYPAISRTIKLAARKGAD
jgi:hypothetical protein